MSPWIAVCGLVAGVCLAIVVVRAFVDLGRWFNDNLRT